MRSFRVVCNIQAEGQFCPLCARLATWRAQCSIQPLKARAWEYWVFSEQSDISVNTAELADTDLASTLSTFPSVLLNTQLPFDSLQNVLQK